MRNLIAMKRWPICLVAAAAAACTGSPANNMAVDGNAAAANEAVADTANAAAGNEAAAPAADNAAAPAEAGNAAAGASDASYHASGTEPFWSLSLGAARMVYDSANGPDVTVATPEPQQTRSGPIYATPQMSVRINRFQRCTEPSGEEVHDTVSVTIGTQTVTGCGEGRPPR
jgi:uncharacterized membrane protein